MYQGLQSSIWSNRFRTILLIALFPTFLFGIILGVFTILFFQDLHNWNNALNSSLITTLDIFIILGPIILIWLLISFLFHRQIIFSFSEAKPITRKDYPEIYNIVENLCISRGLPTPNIGIIEDDSLNAFATGWNPKNAWIVFSRGIINKLNKQELEAVAAHELTHIINKDSMLMIVVIVFVGIIATIGEIVLRITLSSGSSSDDKKDGRLVLIMMIVGIVLLILGYIMFPIIQLAISRRREYLADAGAVELTKDKYAMISALQKISGDPIIESIKKQTVAAMCIENPFKGKDFFSTHPSIEKRIKALESY